MTNLILWDLAVLAGVLSGSAVAGAQSSHNQSPSSNAGEQVFTQRLKAIVGTQAVDCGTTLSSKPDDAVTACGLKAFQDGNPFLLGYYTRFAQSLDFAYGLARDSAGNVFMVSYQGRAFPAVAPTRHTRLFDDNHSRVTQCIKPVTLDKTRRGLLACVTPINQEESDRVAHQTPVDTTVCSVLENPASFNNRLVRLRGHFSGNFEYSTLSGDGCQDSLWFMYAGGSGPPSLSMWVGGGASPGSEDSEGRLVLPVPIQLVRDSKFDSFEKQTVAMAKADSDYEKEHPNEYASHCVTATFIGRIDAVSPDVHEFRKQQKTHENSDGLGFGQMGLYEAQLILQSVADDSALGLCHQ